MTTTEPEPPDGAHRSADDLGGADELLGRLARTTAAFAREHGADASACHALEQLRGRWDARLLPVVVVGEVSTGKSTLINALLGRRLLPTHFATSTAAWTHLRHGHGFGARAWLRSATGGTVAAEIAEADLGAYLSVDGERLVIDRHGRDTSVEYVDITLPAPILRDGLQLLDTPGVGGLRAAHRRAALAALVEADAVMFVTKPGAPLTRSERLFLAEAVERVTACVVVQTHRDETRDADRTLEKEMATLRDPEQWSALLGDAEQGRRLADRFVSVPGVSVSARNALDVLEPVDGAVPAGSDQLLAASQLSLLREVLDTEVVDRGNSLHRANIRRLVTILLTDVRTRAEQRIAVLQGVESASTAISRRETRIARWVAHDGDYWRKQYDAVCESLPRELNERAANHAAALDLEYRAKLRGLKPAEIRMEVQQLLGEPELAYTELVRFGNERLDAAVARVRALMDQEGIGETFEQKQQAKKVFERLAVPKDAGWQVDVTDVPTVLGGGITAVAVTAVGAAVLEKAGLLVVGGMTPVFWPFVIGAAVFGGISAHRKYRARTENEAADVLMSVCREVRTTAAKAALEVLGERRKELATGIQDALIELGGRVREDRHCLSERAGLTAEQRATRVAEHRAAIARADTLLGELAGPTGTPAV